MSLHPLLKIFPENFLLAFAATVLSDVGAVILIAFDLVDSDYLHLFLVMLFVLLAGYYMERKPSRILLGMSVVGMLAMLQRYLGIAAIGMGVFIIFFSKAESLRQRLIRSSLMALSALPAGIWLLVTFGLRPRAGQLRRKLLLVFKVNSGLVLRNADRPISPQS